MATVLVHSGLERMTFYDGCGTHHVRNPSRPSPRFSYCKRQKLGWRPGNEASLPHPCPPRQLHVHVPYSRESPPMGAAPYFLKKQGGGRSFECFRIQPRKSAHLGGLLRVSAFTYRRVLTFVYVAESARAPKPSHHFPN